MHGEQEKPGFVVLQAQLRNSGAPCLRGFGERFCSVPLAGVNEGNELGNGKELLPGELFHVPNSFHGACFLVAIPFVDFENERRHFHSRMSPWCPAPHGRISDTPLSAGGWGAP